MGSRKRPVYLLPEESVGALVVDSEGYIYGRVEEVRFEGDRAFLVASVDVDVGDEVIDEGKLRGMLASMGYAVEDLELQELVSLARRRGLPLPKVKARRRERVVKGVFPLEEVEWIDRGLGEYVMLLSTPREARYRGVAGGEKPSPRNVGNKLALSLSRGFLGVVVGVAIGPGELALRVSPRPALVNWLRFTAELRRRGYRELEEKLSNLIDPYKNPKIGVESISGIEEVLENSPREVRELLEECVEWSEYVHIPWREVLKVGDVVILK
ncbi:MAG: hypothetical protein DRN06_06980 [Thermoprotei archaeon]|nr:MAG: hypothetical protein DRN06_06980 [Thermoprotei archaeon]